MKNTIKWIVIICGGLFILAALIILIVPFFIDVNQFKPKIENMISEETGRPFSIKGEIDLSLFPWAGLSCQNASMGNPEGFEEKEFASIEALDLRVKILPLLSRDLQLSFVLQKPKIVLVTGKNGKVNYDFSKKAAKKDVSEKKTEKRSDEKKTARSPSIRSLNVEKFLISDGQVLIIDHGTASQKEISDITAKLDNVSLDRPISLSFSANMDKIPFSLEGNIGPVGTEMGKGNMPVDVRVMASEQLEITVKGRLIDMAENPRFDLKIKSNSFSPKKLAQALNRESDIKTADADVLNKLSFEALLTGTPEAIDLKNGSLSMDDTIIRFEGGVKAFEKPDIRFNAQLDKIDVDRYLPPKQTGQTDKTASGKEPASAQKAGSSEKTDYKALRSLVLNGTLKAADVKINNVRMSNLDMKITGSKGIFKIDPFFVALYDGTMNLTCIFNVQTDVPKTAITVKADKIKANPLIKAMMDKDVIEGGLKADVDIRMAGEDPDAVKRSLDGNMNIVLSDGAIKGIDLAAMAQNIKSAFGQSQARTTGEQPRTNFSELSGPFVIRNGVVNTTGTKMISPRLQVEAKGKADLVKELLDLKVEPKFVAADSGQGDAAKRSSIMVPVLITGSFSSPKFSPDVEGIIKQTLEGGLPTVDDLKNILKGDSGSQTTEEEKPRNLEDTAKDLLKNLPFGR